MELVNNLSPELSKIVSDARPKNGQVIYFQSLRLQAGGTSVKSIDRIFDPYVKNSDGTKGSYVDIAYVTGQTPARGGMPAAHNFGRIQFSKSTGNIIGLSGNNRGDDTLFQYFFLCNFNKINMGKPWYSPGEGQMPLFEMQLPEMDAKEKNSLRRKIRMAGDKIDEMPDSKLLDFALSLEMVGITQFSKMEEIRSQLFAIAEGDPVMGIRPNPDKIMNMDKDVNLTMKLFIKEALKYGLWEEDKALKLFVWPETKEPVFLMTPGQDLYQETIKYLLGNGTDTHSLVSGLIEKKKAKEKNNKPSIDGNVHDAINDARNASDKAPNKKFKVEFSEAKDD